MASISPVNRITRAIFIGASPVEVCATLAAVEGPPQGSKFPAHASCGCDLLDARSNPGKLLHVFNIAAGTGTTNLAIDRDEKNLYVAVVKDPKDPQARGMVVKIANVK
jgi:hypothetical protein